VSGEVHVEKRKWNGVVSSIDERAHLVSAPPSSIAWFVPRGSIRTRPRRIGGPATPVEHDELWLAPTDDWWVLCAEADEHRIVSLVLHAATPIDRLDEGMIAWIDLDLDFEVRGDDLRLEDEAEFHRHAASMPYPPEVIRGAWRGVSQMAARYTAGEWPFDGWLDEAIAAVGDPT
jgi:hypothetical protein